MIHKPRSATTPPCGFVDPRGEGLPVHNLSDDGVPALSLIEESVAAQDYPSALRVLASAWPELSRSPDERIGLALGAMRLLLDELERDPAEILSRRELTIIRELALDRTIGQIAAEFFISPNTVKSHVSHIYRKLQVGNRRDALRRVHELGIEPDAGTDGAGSSSRAAAQTDRVAPSAAREITLF